MMALLSDKELKLKFIFGGKADPILPGTDQFPTFGRQFFVKKFGSKSNTNNYTTKTSDTDTADNWRLE